MYHRDSGWLYDKNRDDIKKIIADKLTEEENIVGSLLNPFLTIDVKDIKLPMIKKLTEKLNLEMIFNFINEGNLNSFDKNTIPYFSDCQIKAANTFMLIAQQCGVEIIANDIKIEYRKYLLLKEIAEYDIVMVICNIFILTFYYNY